MLTHSLKASQRAVADAVVVPCWEGTDKKAIIACRTTEFNQLMAPVMACSDFHGKEGDMAILYAPKATEKRVILFGLGSSEKCSAELLRRSYGLLLKTARRKKWKSINICMPEAKELDENSAAVAVCEGLLLSNYAFDYKSKSEENHSLLQKIGLCGLDKKAFEACQEAATVVEAVNFARDLINGNADDVTAQKLSAVAKDLAKKYSGVKTTILDKKALEKEKMGLLLAVNQGADREPALIVVEYNGNPRVKKRTALVGKGITYDTGGLLIKPRGGMETMKDDMSGGAAVLGTIRAAAQLKLKVNLVGVVPAAENAVGPRSYKPGDVYKSRAGISIEIHDTDAEGRLVLADALTYVQDKYAPARIIDLATLTGGILVAIGDQASGLFANDEKLAKDLMEAGSHTFERLWRMPLYPEYKEAIKSQIADFKNSSGSRNASPCIGATFLHQFIKKGTAWAHLDIAGTAFFAEPKPYHPTNATGVGVRLLIAFLKALKDG